MSDPIVTTHNSLFGPPKTPPPPAKTKAPKKPTSSAAVFVPPKIPPRLTPTNHVITVQGAKDWSVEIAGFHDKESYLSDSVVHTDGQVSGDYPSIGDVSTNLLSNRRSQKKPENETHSIAQSTADQYDVVARPKLSKKLAERLQSKENPSDLATQYISLKNGLNQVSYKTKDGTLVHSNYASAGNGDSENTHLQMAKRIAPLHDDIPSAKAPSYCYTGRPDTADKALEQAEMIFFGEIDSDMPKGISSDKAEDGEAIYTLHYMVNSLQSSSPFNRDEHTSFEKEKDALKALQNSGIRTITHPKTGKTFRVRFNPMFFSRQVDDYANMEKGLNSWLAGSQQALEASREGWNKLRSYASIYIPTRLNEQERALALGLINKIEASINERHFGGSQMKAEEELLCRSMLCLLLDLPLAYHAKNHTLHADIGVALHITLCQWIKKGFSLRDSSQFEHILDNETFKELFAMNWLAAQKSQQAAEEIVEEEGLIREPIDGTTLNDDIEHSALLARLLPSRYVKESSRVESLWNASCKRFGRKKTIALLVASPILLPLLGLANAITTLFTPNGTLSKPKDSGTQRWVIRPLRFVARNLYMIPYNFFTGLFTPFLAAPAKTIDFKTLGKNTPHALTPIPSNAGKKAPTELASHLRRIDPSWNSYELAKKSQEEIYDLFFEERFGPHSAPVHHILRGNVVEHAIASFHNTIGEHLGRIAIPNKKWKISGQEFHNLKDMYQYLLKNHNLTEEEVLEIMIGQIPDLGQHLLSQIKTRGPFEFYQETFTSLDEFYFYLIDTKRKSPVEALNIMRKKIPCVNDVIASTTRKSRIFHAIRDNRHSLWIDGQSFNQPEKAYEYLTLKKHLRKEQALDILSCMQINATHYAQTYLKTTLASDDLDVEVDLHEAAKTQFRLDTNNWTLAIQNENEIYREGDIPKETHAIIRTTTLLNCNRRSKEFGQGSVQCELVGDYVPLASST
jgi:hypothetical protein